MILREDEVYYWVKTLLRRAGIDVFGGEPPGGTNDVHRIELKAAGGSRKGSVGSRKFDLVAHHLARLLLIELKGDAAELGPDIDKLRDTVASGAWTGALWDSLSERGLIGKAVPTISRADLIAGRADLLIPCIGASPSDVVPPDGFLLFEVAEGRIRVRASTFRQSGLLQDLGNRLAPFSF